jgi:23S rRNA (adenine-N6)-dimethyltransferase
MKRHISHSQNFLHNTQLVKTLLNNPQINIKPTDLVLEIGAGKGIISTELNKRINANGKLILIEIDDHLTYILQDRFGESNNIEIINKDFIDYRLPSKPFKVISNLPFNFTSDILRKLLVYENFMQTAYLIMQKKAAARWGGSQIISREGESLQSLLKYPFYKMEIIYEFSRKDFKPKSNVQCVLIKIQKRVNPLISAQNHQLYTDFVAAISGVRVGEGIWKKLFSPKQFHQITNTFEIQNGRGINSQIAKSILQIFRFWEANGKNKSNLLHGTMAAIDQRNKNIDKKHRTR